MDAGNSIPLVAAPELREMELSDPFAEIHWYAAYTFANHEKKVAAELQRRSVECFLPLYPSIRRWKDRRVKLDLPLFPGYIFVRFALQNRLRVLQTPGVVRFVGFDTCAAPVPEIDITRVREILAQGFRAEPHPYLAAGRHVRVKVGPLQGLEGIIVRRKNKVRFVVSIELIQRSMAVEVEDGCLEQL